MVPQKIRHTMQAGLGSQENGPTLFPETVEYSNLLRYVLVATIEP